MTTFLHCIYATFYVLVIRRKGKQCWIESDSSDSSVTDDKRTKKKKKAKVKGSKKVCIVPMYDVTTAYCYTRTQPISLETKPLLVK